MTMMASRQQQFESYLGQLSIDTEVFYRDNRSRSFLLVAVDKGLDIWTKYLQREIRDSGQPFEV